MRDDGGYQSADTLEPANGYRVMALQSGKIVLRKSWVMYRPTSGSVTGGLRKGVAR